MAQYSLWQITATEEGPQAFFRPLLSASLLVVLTSLLLLLLLRCRQQYCGQQVRLNLPPSPFVRLPVLGNLLRFKFVRGYPCRASLGPIFTLYMGRAPLIFVTSAALAHEALVTESRLFADRPLLPSRALFTSNFREISSAPYGPFWRTLRRNLVQEMLSLPKILSFKPARARALASMVSGIRSEAERNQGVVSVFPCIRRPIYELLLLMCFGFQVPENDALRVSEVLDAMLKYVAGQMFDFFPFLKVLNRKQQAENALRAEQVQLFTSLFEKHKELEKLGGLTPGSYLETLLRMQDLSTEDMVTLCSEFMVGGTDTTVTTLEWTMAELVRDPSIQAELYRQVHDVVGADRLVEETDLPHLPYLQAVVKEALRLHPPGHSLLPHCVSAPCKLGGYDIPPDAMILFDVMSIAQDPAIWKEPLSFKPQRFLDYEQGVDVDITGSKEVTMIPFGAGRRICPGLGLGTVHLEMVLARLVQAFEWACHPPGKPVDLALDYVLTIRMKYPLKASVKERGSPVDLVL